MVQFATDGRPLPSPTPISQPYFDAAARGELQLQRCPRDGVFYYPRSVCPRCWKTDWQWQALSGRGEVHSFTIDRVGHDPALAAEVPYCIALVDLEEGARVVANVVSCPVESVRIGLPVEATFDTFTADSGETLTLLRFRPRQDSPAL